MDKKLKRQGVIVRASYWLLALVVIGSLGLIAWAVHARHTTDAGKQTITYRANGVPAGGTVLLSALKGNGNARSPVFEAPANWHVYWSFICYDEDQPATLHIAATGENGQPVNGDKPVAARGISGFGDQPYDHGGRIYLAITSSDSCQWQISVKAF